MKREDGFYWVRKDVYWEVAKFANAGEGSYWTFCGCDIELRDEDFDEIGEQIKKPEN